MAPFNLSDLAVKELKIPSEHLAPTKARSFTGNFLMGLFLDFWAQFWMTSITVALFKGSLDVFLTTEKLQSAWDFVDLSPITMFGWGTFAFSYFFFSFYFNQGQTWGMKLTKCRISMDHHSARSALRWSVFALSLFFTLGLSYNRGTKWLAETGAVKSHDHLWQDLMAQKEAAAPDVMTLVPEETVEEMAEAA